MQKVIIIGSGLGGLSAAVRLQQRGYQVTVFEKQPRAGGRSNLIVENGFRVDPGPTILVMKETFEALYEDIGLNLHDRIDLIQLDPNYRIYFHDDTHIDLHANMARLTAELEKVEPGAGEKLFAFLGSNALKYAVGMGFVTRNYDRITDLANLPAVWQMLKTGSHERLYRQVSRFFQSDKLRKAFSFHSMFLGLSPFDSLAMYSLITYADLARGMYYPRGGIYRIVEDLLQIAAEKGAEIHTNTPVAEILIRDGQARGVRLESGEEQWADIIISNADLPYTYRSLIPARHRRSFSDKRLEKMDYACSGYLLYLGLDRSYPEMCHQALYFSEDYDANLADIFKHKRIPADPSFHLNNPTITDPALAPPGHSILYVLAPMPNLQNSQVDWAAEAPMLREKLLAQVARLVDPDLRKHITWEKSYTPLDFRRDYNAVHGNAFGSLAHGLFQSAFFRPHNIARDIPGLYFVGQGTYPGIGMPMVLISSDLVVQRIVEKDASLVR
jgi:phytoene desaturase